MMRFRMLVLVATTAVLAGCAQPAPPKDMRAATLEGRRLDYRVDGSGRPALVLIPGLGDGMPSFRKVVPELAKTMTVIRYNRPGIGWSTPTGRPNDAVQAERDLSAVLAQSGVPGPYVVAGHSLGGLFAQYYAARHPDTVAGLILEDSTPTDLSRRCRAHGLGDCEPPGWIRALLSLPLFRGPKGDFDGLSATYAQVEAAGPVKDKPVLVLTRHPKPKPSAVDRELVAAQADLAARYPGSRHLNAPSGGHAIHLDTPDWFVAQVRSFATHLKSR